MSSSPLSTLFATAAPALPPSAGRSLAASASASSAGANDFSRALARSVDTAQQNARRDQSVADNRRTEAGRAEAKRAEDRRAQDRRAETARPAPTDKTDGLKKPNNESAAQAPKVNKAKPAETPKEETANDRVAQALGLLGLTEPATRMGSNVLAKTAAAEPKEALESADGEPGLSQLAARHNAAAGAATGAAAGAATGAARSADELAQAAGHKAGSKEDATRHNGDQSGELASPGLADARSRADAANAMSADHDSAAQAAGPDAASAQGGPHNAAALSANANAQANPATSAASATPAISAKRASTTAQGLAGRAPLAAAVVAAAGNAQSKDSFTSQSRVVANHATGTYAAASAADARGPDKQASSNAQARGNEAQGNSVFSLPQATTAGDQPGLAVVAGTGVGAGSEAAATSPEAGLPSYVTAQLEPEVGTPAWQQALNQQIMQMRRGNANEAELQLNPLGLGSLRIKLSLHDQQLNAEFSAAHAQVREALEAALPQLREALQQGGIQLGQAVVGAGTQSGQNGSNLAGSGFAGSGEPGAQGQGDGQASSRAANPPHAPQALTNPAADALAAQGPRTGPGQRLNTFA